MSKTGFLDDQGSAVDGFDGVITVHGEGFDTMLKYSTREVNGVLIISFEATDADVSDWHSTQREWLYKLVETQANPWFAIDLTDVNYLASSEIGFLVSLKRRIDRRPGKVVVFGVGPYIMDIFKTMNLHKVLDIVADQAVALLKLTVAAG
jgi:anti-sigma B factor antagonist